MRRVINEAGEMCGWNTGNRMKVRDGVGEKIERIKNEIYEGR